MKKIFFLSILVLSILLEVYLCFQAFYDPPSLISSYGITYSKDLQLPMYLIAWFLLLIVLLIVVMIYQLLQNNFHSYALLYTLCLWWVGIGIGIYFYAGTGINLLTDSVKGIALFVAAYLYQKDK